MFYYFKKIVQKDKTRIHHHFLALASSVYLDYLYFDHNNNKIFNEKKQIM